MGRVGLGTIGKKTSSNCEIVKTFRRPDIQRTRKTLMQVELVCPLSQGFKLKA